MYLGRVSLFTWGKTVGASETITSEDTNPNEADEFPFPD